MSDSPVSLPDHAPAAAPAMKPRASWLTRLLLVFLLLLHVATLVAGYWLWRHIGMGQQADAAQSQSLGSELQQLKNELAEQEAGHTRFRQQTISTLKETSEKLRGLDRIDTSYWRLAEAEFLLKQAHQRLFITKDAETADLLLASADAAIMQQKDPSLLPVRSAIAQDRAALRKVPRVDRDGIYLRLQALSAQVGALTSENRFLQSGDGLLTEADSVLGYGEQLWQRLLSIVRIRHYDQPVMPLLPPEQELYLRQNLQLALVQSQLGLLQGHQETYAGNLERAFAWVNQYCDSNDPVVRSWIEEAQTLMRIDTAPALPDISGSLRSVQKLIEQRAEEIQRTLLLEDGELMSEDDDGDAPAAVAEPVTEPAAEGTP